MPKLAIATKCKNKSTKSSSPSTLSLIKQSWTASPKLRLKSKSNISSSMWTLSVGESNALEDQRSCSTLSLNSPSSSPTTSIGKKPKWYKKLLSPNTGSAAKLSADSDSSLGLEKTTKKKKSWYRKRFRSRSESRQMELAKEMWAKAQAANEGTVKRSETRKFKWNGINCGQRPQIDDFDARISGAWMLCTARTSFHFLFSFEFQHSNGTANICNKKAEFYFNFHTNYDNSTIEKSESKVQIVVAKINRQCNRNLAPRKMSIKRSFWMEIVAIFMYVTNKQRCYVDIWIQNKSFANFFRWFGAFERWIKRQSKWNEWKHIFYYWFLLELFILKIPNISTILSF